MHYNHCHWATANFQLNILLLLLLVVVVVVVVVVVSGVCCTSPISEPGTGINTAYSIENTEDSLEQMGV